MQLPVEVVADHIGGMKGISKLRASAKTSVVELVNSTNQPGLNSLIRLAEKSKIYIKISGLYRASTETKYSDLEPLVRTLAKKVPHRLIWASDWPHTGEAANRKDKNPERMEKFRDIDNISILNSLKQWVSDDEVWLRMMVTTPHIVYT
jgi:predicted TIM-barrel fold metal-dependent hydrolase